MTRSTDTGELREGMDLLKAPKEWDGEAYDKGWSHLIEPDVLDLERERMRQK
jgi:hypothetical protein